ncbi:MAG: transcriptional regulator PpsR [Pseudomonadota bacterium]
MRVANSEAGFLSPEKTISGVDAEAVSRTIGACSDVVLVMDRDGVIQDVAGPHSSAIFGDRANVVEKRWIDTVTKESRTKVDDMLRDAPGGAGRWREVNHKTDDGSAPFRYTALDFGENHLVAVGRNLSDVSDLQQRLLEAQQEMEREYMRVRQAETRYRLLFQMASEPVLISEQKSGAIVEANPAAREIFGRGAEELVGKRVDDVFHPSSRDKIRALAKPGKGPSSSDRTQVRLARTDERFEVAASVFRQEAAAHVLWRLWPADQASTAEAKSSDRLLRILNRIPDAFVLVNEDFEIVEANLAFLELIGFASVETAKGRPLKEYLGRRPRDLAVLESNLGDHGWARNFETVLTSVQGLQDNVEISAVAVSEGLEAYTGLVIRLSRRGRAAAAGTIKSGKLPTTVEQLTDLVGRLSLREIVRETTDVIERLCIETALGLSGNNRASAAEMLGVSRQSLYVKLNRYGLRNEGSGDKTGG